MKLYQRFAEKGYHSSIVTTFGIDFDAYEAIVLPRLRGAGCSNNMVIADYGMLTHALDTAIQLPGYAGRQYTLTGANSKGVFHPKVVVQLGRKSGRMIVCSANMTAPGLAGNLEVAGHVSGADSDAGECSLLAAGLEYVQRFLDPSQEAISHQLEWMRRRTPWLLDHAPATGLVSLSSGDQAAFIDGNQSESITARFVAMVDGDPVKRLVVVSPFWDEDLKALLDLQRALGAAEVCVLVGGLHPSFPSTRLDRLESVRLYKLEVKPTNRYVHAKIVIAQGRDADHVLYGSANCTVAALGLRRGVVGTNDEACLYRRMKPRAALRQLDLEGSLAKGNIIAKVDLPEWAHRPEIPLQAAIARNPGRFEAREGILLWWPSPAYATSGTTIELLGRDGSLLSAELVSLESREEGSRRFAMVDLAIGPSFARVRTDGSVSAPEVVVLTEVLRSEVREVRRRDLDDGARRLGGNEKAGPWILDFIDLVDQAEGAEAKADGKESKSARRALAGKHKIGGAAVPVAPRTLTYDEFMANRKQRDEKQSSARSEFAGSDLSLVRQYLNRLIGYSIPDPSEPEPDNDAEVKEALEVQDEGIEPDDSHEPDSTTQPDEIREVEARAVDINQNQRKKLSEEQKEREKLRKMVARRLSARDDLAWYGTEFNRQLLEKADAQGLSLPDVLRLRAILVVMLGSAFPVGTGHITQGAEETRTLRSNGEDSWPSLIGKVLYTFFSGPKPGISRLAVSPIHDQPPAELPECLATCFWALQACRAAAMKQPEMAGLSKLLDELSAHVYRKSGLRHEELITGPVVTIFERMSSHFLVGIEPEVLMALHGESVRKLGRGNDDLAAVLLGR